MSSYYDICIGSAHTAAYLSASYDNISSGLILLYMSAYYYMCLHTTLYVSSYCCACVHILRYMCPHTTICVRILLYVSSYSYICVLILLSMCPQPPHTDPWLSRVSLHHLIVCTLASSSTVLLLLLSSHRRSIAAGAYEDTYIAV